MTTTLTTDPGTDARLEALMTRLEHTLDTLEPVVPLAQKAPDMIAMAVDTFDDLVARDAVRVWTSMHVCATRWACSRNSPVPM